MKGQIIIFSIVGCPFCIRSKGYLEQLGLEYVDINLDKNPAARKAIIERTGKKTVPQIFFNEVHVGGWDHLSKLTKEELDQLIKKVEENESPPDAPQLKDFKTEEDDNGEDAFDFHCELDEYGELVKELRESGLVKDRKKGLKTYKNSFVGKEVVDWLVKAKSLERHAAIDMCQQLVDRHFGHSVNKDTATGFKDDATIYRFIEDDEGTALNSNIHSACEPQPASLLGEELRQLILSIYNSHLSRDGKKVDYKAIADDPKFKTYVKHTGILQRVILKDATRQEKLAFFINIYNALVIHAFVAMGPPVNMWQRYKFFNTVSYVISGYTYSLNDIENGILRANRKPIGSLRKPFPKGDPRLLVALPNPEPKVHFALVCGAKSCPPIKTYSAADIDNQLRLAAESFLEGDGCTVDIQRKEVKVSQILKWYKEDFGSNKMEIASFVYKHMGDCEKRTQLNELINSGSFKLSHIPYDWGVNSK